MKPTYWPAALCAIFATVTYTTSAAEQLTILGLETGMSVAQAKATLPALDCTTTPGSEFGDQSCRIYGTSNSNVEYGGVLATYLAAHFYDDKLATVAIRFKEAAFTSISNGLVTKFGQPSEQLDGSIQNKMGATFQNKELRWKNDSDHMIAIQRSGRIDESQVRLSSNSSAAEYERRIKEKAKSTAGKL